MIHVREAGGLLRNGFNFYPLRDKWNKGFILKLGRLKLRVRYSVFQGRLIFGIDFPSGKVWGRGFPRKPRDRTEEEYGQRLTDGILVTYASER